eukprot:m.233416 g.233416  ORF g.233416 m.233416 type:complete len:633 (+) comp18900_c0_seq4:218-2116(+)
MEEQNAQFLADLKREYPGLDVGDMDAHLAKLGGMFMAADKDGSGDMDLMEINKMLLDLGKRLEKQDLRDMVSRVDDDNSGTLRYREFLNLMLIEDGWLARPLADDKPSSKRLQKQRHGAIKRIQRGHLQLKVDFTEAPDGAWTVTCKIGSAKDLLPMDLFGQSDPYVKCYILPDASKKTKQKTEVCRKTLNPTFDKTLTWTFPAADGYKGKRLHVTVWDWDMVTKNDFMGAMSFDLEELSGPDTNVDGWYILLDEVQGEQQFFPSRVDNAGAPLDIKRVSLPATGSIKTRPTAQKETSPLTPSSFNYLKVLGRGSFGKVMLAESKSTKQIYAVKVLKKVRVVCNNDVGATMTEKMILSIEDDPKFLITCVASFQTKGNLYFVMNLVTGGDLMFHAMNEGCFSEQRTAFYTAEICCGLFFLHDRGIFYRDLKLDNVMLDSEGHVKIADFGLCKIAHPDSKTSTFCGTPNYLAPEIVEYRQYGMEVDFWSLGVIVFEMLNGMTLFDADDESELFHRIKFQPIRLPRTMPRAGAMICQAFLQRDPASRLGYGPNGKQDIQAHPFFTSLSWSEVEQRKAKPPFVPRIGTDPKSADNFDPEFTALKPIITPVDKSEIAKIDEGLFQGFTYCADGVEV